MKGIFLVNDNRLGLTENEVIPPLVWWKESTLPNTGQAVITFGLPGSDFFAHIPVPDEDDAESILMDEDGEGARYVTPSGVVSFRKPTAADLIDLQLLFPEVEFPEAPSDEELLTFLADSFFSFLA